MEREMENLDKVRNWWTERPISVSGLTYNVRAVWLQTVVFANSEAGPYSEPDKEREAREAAVLLASGLQDALAEVRRKYPGVWLG